MKLTAKSIKSKPAGDHADGGNNLYLRVNESKRTGKTTRQWLFRYMLNGKRTNITIGDAGLISLKEARDQAFTMKQRLAHGSHPAVEGEYKPFRECFDELLEHKRQSWSNARSEKQWRHSIETYASGLLDKDIGTITTADITKVLKPIWAEKSETAGRIRQRIESVIEYANAMEYCSIKNPAKWNGNLEYVMPSLDKVQVKKHHGAMPYKQVPKFMTTLINVDAAGARALRFLILTGARTGEVIGATHQRVVDDVWERTASEMKAKKPHKIPLSDAAMDCLKLPLRLTRKISPNKDFLFSNIEGEGLSNMAMYRILKNRCYADKFTVHGFRTSFRTWAMDTGVDYHAAELCLSHNVQTSVQAAYQRSDLLELRRKIMEDWAEFVMSKC